MSQVKSDGDKDLRPARESEFHLNEEFIRNELVSRIKASQRGRNCLHK